MCAWGYGRARAKIRRSLVFKCHNQRGQPPGNRANELHPPKWHNHKQDKRQQQATNERRRRTLANLARLGSLARLDLSGVRIHVIEHPVIQVLRLSENVSRRGEKGWGGEERTRQSSCQDQTAPRILTCPRTHPNTHTHTHTNTHTHTPSTHDRRTLPSSSPRWSFARMASDFVPSGTPAEVEVNGNHKVHMSKMEAAYPA